MAVLGVYAITNLKNGKIYIGSTVNFKTRWKDHKKDLRHDNHCNLYLQASWNKYGEEAFEFSILECVDSSEELFPVEQFWLDTYKEKGKELYNIALAVDNPMRGRKHTEESKRLMSEARKGFIYTDEIRRNMSIGQRNRPPMPKETRQKISKSSEGNQRSLGYRHTEGAKQRIGEAHKGKIVSEETRRKNSEAHRGERNAMYGKKHSEESRRRMSESCRRAWAIRRARVSYVLDCT